MTQQALLDSNEVSGYDGLGGKASLLLRLTRANYRVPKWFVVPCGYFERVIADHRARISSVLARAATCHPDEMVSLSTELMDLFSPSGLGNAILAELEEAVCQRLTSTIFYAVRSSVNGEDSVEHSFAGLMDTHLHVRKQHVAGTICRVWGSAFSPRALLYRQRKGIPLDGISTAVIVQEMVEAVSSGVLFTHHPESGAQECVISAGFGLGEGVVCNVIDSDTYVASWDGTLCRKTIATKGQKIVPFNGTRSGTTTVTVDPGEQSLDVLTGAQIRLLVQTGTMIEREFGLPQDIEWSFDAAGRLFFLQARPIGFQRREPRNGEFVRLWDNSNIVESYPGLTLPLTFSFVLEAYQHSFRRAAQGFFPFKRTPSSSTPIFDNMIGLIDGRVYYNLLNWYEMMSYLPGFEKHKTSWDQMIGISEKIDFPETPVPWVLRLLSSMIAIRRLLSIEGNARRFLRTFENFYARASGLRFDHMNPLELVRAYSSIRSELNGFWHKTLFNDFAAMKFYGWLKSFCDRYSSAEEPNLHNELLCGEHGVESVKPVRSLVAMCEWINAHPHLRGLVDEAEPEVLWKRIQLDSGFSPLKQMLTTYLAQYGDRGIEELKLERETFRDNPAAVLGLLKVYCRQNMTVASMERNERSIRERAQRAIATKIRNPVALAMFRFVLRNARRAVANRENMRFARTRIFGIIRILFRTFGIHLCSAGIIADAQDVFYLTMEEAFGAARATLVTKDLKTLVELRKGEYRKYAMRPAHERFSTFGFPLLLLPRDHSDTAHGTGTLTGIGCSSGVVEGEAVVVDDPRRADGTTGKILIARSTDPGWVFLMLCSKGIVVEKGSVLSHTAIIGRELGIPTIVGVKNATRIIPTGSQIRIDGGKGVIRWN